jgi:hypothetical protein
MTPGQGGEALLLVDDIEMEEFKRDEIDRGFLDKFGSIQAGEVFLALMAYI